MRQITVENTAPAATARKTVLAVRERAGVRGRMSAASGYRASGASARSFRAHHGHTTAAHYVRQASGEPRRRWFASNDLDLIVWCDDSGSPIGFQLCYDKLRSEHALTWKPELGFVHTAVDDGEDKVGLRYKSTPILVADGRFDANGVSDLFCASSGRLPPDIVKFVTTKLRQHPNYLHRA